MRFLVTAVIAAGLADAIAVERRATASEYPFSNIVGFGDELSDDGSGSYAHGITGDPATVYGYGTWTNGPVAVMYLAKMLGVSLDDYAFGGCCGGGSFGATIDEEYTTSPANAQSVKQQITNYTSAGAPNAANSLGFVWVGENDLSAHTDAFWLGDPHNAGFASDFSSLLVGQVSRILSLGVPTVFVANIYPKHIAPVTAKYLCVNNPDCVKTWGQVIDNANAAIKTALAQFGSKVIYYDVNAYMQYVYKTPAIHGFSAPNTTTVYCDGDETAKWQDCVTDGHGNTYMWMNFIQPSTAFHWFIARDMKRYIDKHYAS